MSYSKVELQSAMIRALASEPAGFLLVDSLPHNQFYPRMVQELGVERIDYHDFLQTIWSLVRQGMVYSHPYSDKFGDLHILLTDAGKAAANDQESNPDNSSEYLLRLRSQVPEASAVVMHYAEEALASYLNCSYLVCAVMLGVASEAAFLDLARSFAQWLPSSQAAKLLPLIDGKKTSFNQKFQAFRDYLGPQKSALARYSQDLADGLTLDAIIEQLRIYRNDAGHPTGRRYDRATMFVHLQMFAILLRKMYDLRNVFDQNLAAPVT